MRGQVSLILILATTAAWPQVAPGATGGYPTTDTQMMTPPPVSGIAYPTEVGAEARTNYLNGGLTTTAAYVNNLYAGSSYAAMAETTVSLLPTIAYDTTTARQHTRFSYSAGFTFYQPSSTLNEVDNTVTFNYSFRLTQHATLSAADRFQDSSSPFIPGQAGGSVSGGGESFTPGAIPPFAKRLTNSASVEFTLQTAPNVMIGGSGSSMVLHFPDPAQTPGLYDSSSRGGTFFYNRRISRSHYFGAFYQYMDMLTDPANGINATQTQAQNVTGFYTFYPMTKLSLSVSAGPQYYRTVQTPEPVIASWGLSLSTSMGWQGPHTSFAANYSQAVTGGGGLVGAYHSRTANASARWQMTRLWIASASGAYAINESVSPLLIRGDQSGHSISGTATLERRLGNQCSIAFHYDRIHQSYGEIAAIAADPNSDRETISITWHFARPLGR